MASNDDNTKNSKDFRKRATSCYFCHYRSARINQKKGARRNDFLFEIERHESN